MPEIRVNDLLHRPIENPSGTLLGAVADVIIDVRQGRIDYVEVELADNGPPRVGKSRPPGERAKVLIDWSQFEVPAGMGALTLDFSLAVLKAVSSRRG